MLLKLINKFKKNKNKNSNFSDRNSLNNHLKDLRLNYNESIIIGNGPSLENYIKKNHDFFKQKNLFCVNFFLKTIIFFELKPNYSIIVDPYIWKRKIPASYIEDFEQCIENLQKVDWNFTLFLPDDAKVWNWFINVPFSNKNVSIIYFKNIPNYNKNLTETDFLKFQNYQQFPHFQNVLVAAIFFSINLGSKKNYIVGADMNLHQNIVVNHANQLCDYTKHFYDNDVILMPMYKDNGIDIFKISEYFQALSMMFQGFEVIESYSKYLNAKIYNLTENSFIDCFERNYV